MTTDLQSTIEAAWDARDTLGLTTTGAVRDAVETALAGLDGCPFASRPTMYWRPYVSSAAGESSTTTA